jgi:hypothetical protein
MKPDSMRKKIVSPKSTSEKLEDSAAATSAIARPEKMSEFRVAIWFEGDQEYDILPFVFFVSSANIAQKSFQFYFPDPPNSLNYEEAVRRMEAGQTIFLDLTNTPVHYDVYVFVTAAHMKDNLFFVEYGPLVHITTFGWEEYFSPPSVFEYLFHSTMCGALYALTGIDHHKYSTMGCQFEYTRLKEYDRVDIALGYICREHRQQISESLGEIVLADSEHLFKFSWLGKPDDYGSVFYKMKELFSYDLRKDSGYKKKFLERAQANIDDLWFDMGKEIFKAVIYIFVAYLLVKFGLKNQ